MAGLYRQSDCSHGWKSIYILRVAAGPALSTNTGVSKVFFDEWKRRVVVERNLYGPTEPPYSMVMNDSKSIIASLPFGIRRI